MRTRVTKEVSLNACVEAVWQYLSEKEKISKWLLAINTSPNLGEEFKLTGPPKGGWDGTIKCRVLEMEAPRKIVFTWNHNLLAHDTLVTITLKSENGGTRLQLVHEGWERVSGDVKKHINDHSAGWSDHLKILQQIFRRQED